MRFSVVRCIALATLLLGLSLHVLVQATPQAAAAGMAPEKDWMLRKGYSDEIITVTNTQRYRQEWRVPPAPLRTPKQQIWRNVVINDPMGNIDPFGSYLIREKQ